MYLMMVFIVVGCVVNPSRDFYVFLCKCHILYKAEHLIFLLNKIQEVGVSPMALFVPPLCLALDILICLVLLLLCPMSSVSC